MAKSTINETLFSSIKSSLENKRGGSKNLLKMEIGGKYVVRLIPNIKEPEYTFVNYVTTSFTSKLTNENIFYSSPQSIGGFDAMLAIRSAGWKRGEKEDPDYKAIKRRATRYVNCYVVSDSVNPENNGTVKILPLNIDLDNIVKVSMEDSDEGGKAIFDFSDEGRNFNITVTEKGKYANYSMTKFSDKKDLGLTSERIGEIHNEIHDLRKIYPIRTTEEVNEIAAKHWKLTPDDNSSSGSASKTEISERKTVSVENDDEVDTLLKEMGVS